MLGAVISWACEHEHEQVSMSKGTWLNLFLNILHMWIGYF
jgi:hypothetical protein